MPPRASSAQNPAPGASRSVASAAFKPRAPLHLQNWATEAPRDLRAPSARNLMVPDFPRTWLSRGFGCR
eukprot:664464-Alexandrium_andersonii.AAC.1